MAEADLGKLLNEYWDAMEILRQWEQAALALALLRASWDAGIIDVTREQRSVSEIAAATEVEVDVVSDLCEGLAQLGILENSTGIYRVSPPFQLLTGPDAPMTLGNWFGGLDVDIKALEACHTEQKPYQSLSSDETVSIAKSAWGLPSSPLALASFAELDAAIPAVRKMWQCGGLHMELGCGAGRDLLRIAVSYPNVTVVGVDRSRAVLDEVSAQARSLGIADRVQVRCCDARRITETATYDTIMWSQMFFPKETREETACVALRALKPGGFVLLPLCTDCPTVRLIFRHWGIDILSPDGVRRLLVQTGFQSVEVIAHPRLDYMIARSPL